jgi:hypothetical protein
VNNTDELDEVQATGAYWEATHLPPTIHIGMDPEYRDVFVKDYAKDPNLKSTWNSKDVDECFWKLGQRFFRNKEGLLFFRDTDYQPRLCIPKDQVKEIMEEAHKAPAESAHVSPNRLWCKLSSKFYWRRMKLDLEEFCDSCDVCQKVKNRNFTKFGFLIPNPIPFRPYESISLDLIVGVGSAGGITDLFVHVF